MQTSGPLASLTVLTIALCSTAIADVLPLQPISVFSEFTVSTKRMSDETVDGGRAKCLTLNEHRLKLCDILRGDGSYLELRLLRGQAIFGKVLTSLTAFSGQGNFDAAYVDLNHDNRPALLVARMTLSGNGIAIATHGLAVFLPDGDGYRLADWLAVQGLGRESGFYTKDAVFYLEESDWLSSCNIDTGPCGTYLAANWYRWKQDHFEHDTQLPVAMRRLRNSFMSEMNQHKAPYPWFADKRTQQLTRDGLSRHLADPKRLDDWFPALLAGPLREKPLTECTLAASGFVGWAPCMIVGK